MTPVRCHSISRLSRRVPLPLNRQSGFHNFLANNPICASASTVERYAERDPRGGVRANGAMNHPVTQPVSSLLSLLIGSRFEYRLVRKVKNVFAFGTRYRKGNGGFPGTMLLIRVIRSRTLGLATTTSDQPQRSSRKNCGFLSRHTSSRLVSQSTRYHSWPGVTTMTLHGQRCESSCPVCPVATTHVLSLSTVKSKPKNVLIPVRFQRGTLARSRNPAIAIDGFLRNLAVVTWRAAELHHDDIRVRNSFSDVRILYLRKRQDLRYR